jgi:hypothetical protein
LADPSARERYVAALLEHIYSDRYPSATQMRHVEDTLEGEQLEAYVDVLLEKIESDRYPSVPMMHQVERLLDRMD